MRKSFRILVVARALALTLVLLTGTESALAFEILSPRSSACHERILLGTLGHEAGGFLGDGLPSTAPLLNLFVQRANSIGVPLDRATRGVMNEMAKRFHWGNLTPAEIFVLTSFVAGVRSPDTGGSSIVDFNKLRSVHIRDGEQAAHALRGRYNDDATGDSAAIAQARTRIESVLQRVDASWASPLRIETWTFAFRGEHKVSIFGPAFDLGVAAHTIQDTYAHAIRDNSMQIVGISNYLEVILEEFRDGRDGARHSDRLDQCNEFNPFDLMRITEARKQVANVFNASKQAIDNSGSSSAEAQTALNTIFAYSAGCDYANDYCGTEWYQVAKQKFSEPYSIGCGLVKNSDVPPGGPGNPMKILFVLVPLVLVLWMRFLGSKPRFTIPRRRLASFIFAIATSLTALFASSPASAFDDPTGGKPFIPWLWEDQFQPTIMQAGDRGNIGIFAGTVAATMGAHKYDDDVYRSYGNNQKMSGDHTKYGAFLGSGAPGILLALGQVYFDQDNGLMHARSIVLTSATHITTAFVANRKRPNGTNRLSFPSGHAASAFTTATSLAYAYGPWVGVPMFGVATYIAAARMADNAHWFSDTVAAAGLGIFWARASYLRSVNGAEGEVSWTPQIVPGGAVVSLNADF